MPSPSRSPRLVVICVDGATPEMVAAHDLFRIARGGGASGHPVHRLRSVYPSSTAPAHASMLTGVRPGTHGIVGNRFWVNTPLHAIQASQDPLASLHPYDRASLRVPSLLDRLSAAGLKVASVMFPQTFSQVQVYPLADSVFCLYSPSLASRVPLGSADASGAREGQFRFEQLGVSAGFRITVRGNCRETADVWVAAEGGGCEWLLTTGHPANIIVRSGPSALSFALFVEDVDDRSVVLRRGTGVLVLAFGNIAAESFVCHGEVPHSPSITYTANPDHAFYEAPNAPWVTSTALRLLDERPDVLLVRYNQVDHAQEHLFGHATLGGREQRALASEQILATYQGVEEELARLLAALDPGTPCLIFSDHGIDYVEEHVHVNEAVREVGLDREFLFQGDSNCCFLYGDRPLAERERRSLLGLLASRTRAVHQAPPDELRTLGVYASDRCGQLALRSHEHVTFQYGSGPIAARVRSASHGFEPRLAAMDGIWLPLGRSPGGKRPRSILELSAIVLGAAGV